MIYNLFLNSTTDAPLTNYASAIDPLNTGQRIYAINWDFLPENKKYKVTFRFISKSASLTANDLIFLTANFGTSLNSFSGGNRVEKNPNILLGIVKPRQISSSTDCQFSSLTKDNSFIMINRPTNNFLEIKLMSSLSVQYPLAVNYILVLSFEEHN